MEIILKKFDMEAYTARRMKELRGEKVYSDSADDEIARYTRRRIRELRETLKDQRELDNSRWGCYTVGTMGDRDGET
jgi:hypothetical protein